MHNEAITQFGSSVATIHFAEALFSALLSIMLRKGLIADWEFIEEFRKI